MPKLTIDGQVIDVEPGLTVLQACELLGVEIPRFCYHERLSIAGNCRMCLVAMQGSPKAIASCAMPAAEGMVIETNTPRVRAMRKGVMEFLLINHPLDCPICDQGGECDLQDQAMGYGFDRGRFHENKRAVPDKNLGPLIKTIMTRCIHCTRCIRFAEEVAGVPELGATGRGENMRVGTYIEKALTSELSGNMIDLCPVGALTSKPYAYVARPWELTKTETIDVMDAVGSNIRVDARGNEVLRVLPRLNEDINEEWISDKTRFACDGLRVQRLDRPYLREDGRLRPATWDEALTRVAEKLKAAPANRIAAIAGDLVDCESMAALKALFDSLGSPHLDGRQDGAALPDEPRAGYLFNTTIAHIDRADACLIIGANPRWEAPIINARLRKRSRRGRFPVGLVGAPVDLTYDYEHLGDDPTVLTQIASGTHAFAQVLQRAQRPMVILGTGPLRRSDAAAILHSVWQLCERLGVIRAEEQWNGFNALHTAAARVGALELGFVPGEGGMAVPAMVNAAASGGLDVLYLLGADELDTSRLGATFVVYQGHHGDAGARRADVILPGAAYTEKDATYVNLEGRVQRAQRACFPPGDAREDWRILRALSERLGKTLPFSTLEDVRRFMAVAHPVFGTVDEIIPAVWGPLGAEGAIDASPFTPVIDAFYLTNPICRASKTMAECTRVAQTGGVDASLKSGTYD